MKKPTFNFAATLVLFVALACGGGLYAAISSDGPRHLDASNCATCHLAGNRVTAENASTLVASQEALCAKCHLKAIQVSHPSGFAPKSKPPAAYPLDWKGDLTCSTCHDIHGSEPGIIRGAQRGKELCLSCHDANFFEKMLDKGVSTLAGHLGNGSFNVTLLDAYTAECMGCHDNNVNEKISTAVDKNGVVRHAGGSNIHPIGANYKKSATYGGYRPMQMLSKKILLPNGNLSCVSCHEGYAKEHGKLVISAAGSKLCYECHDL